MNMNQQVTADLAAFSEPPPEVLAAQKKEAEARAKKEAANSKALKPEQLKMAQKLTDQMKEEQEAVVKADLIQKLNDYIKLVEEFHPDRVEHLRVKKATPKMTIEELRIAIRDIQNDLGKRGALDVVKMGWVNLFKGVEQLNEDSWMGFNSTGAGKMAENMICDRRTAEGEIVPGPAVPTLAEFATKYGHWFSTGVEVRLALMVANTFATIHRINTNAGLNVAAAKATPASEKSAELAKKL
jgi:hypothetical protein